MKSKVDIDINEKDGLNETGKVKIAYVTTIHNTLDWFVVPTLRNLAQNSFTVSIFSSMDEAFIQKNSDFAKCYKMNFMRGIVNPFQAIRSINQLRKIFKKEKFDIVRYMSPNASFYASMAARLAGIKYRIYDQAGLRYVGMTGFKRRLFKLVEKITCTNSSHIKAQSCKNMEYVVQEKICSKNKISIVGIGGTIGVDLQRFDLSKKEAFKELARNRYGINSKAFVFGFLGRINKDKGIDELLTAFKEILLEYPSCALMICGMYDSQNPIDSDLYAWALNSKSVFFTGNIITEDVFFHLCAMDILVHPTYREGFGMVLQEAMGAQLPIITTDIPGPSEVIENGISGLLVPVKKWTDLKEQMIFLMQNDRLRNNLAKNGRTRVERYFDRPVMLKNNLDDIKKILDESN